MICGMLVRSSWVFLVTCFALIFCGMDICICNKVHVCVIHLLFFAMLSLFLWYRKNA